MKRIVLKLLRNDKTKCKCIYEEYEEYHCTTVNTESILDKRLKKIQKKYDCNVYDGEKWSKEKAYENYFYSFI